MDIQDYLRKLALKYENFNFTLEDPSQFLRYYENPKEAEVAAFIAALLSFGNRKQFIPKIKEIFSLADSAGGILNWLKNKKYVSDFTCAESMEKKFYRFYSYNDMQKLFETLSKILLSNESFGTYIKNLYIEEKIKNPEINICTVFSKCFESCKIVPHGKNSACKRIFMYLRWMVREASPVDLGIWTWYDAKDLIIPLDVHVLEEAKNISLIPENSKADFKTAVLLTNKLKEIWPEDPCKGDFALFGLGVDKSSNKD